MLKAIIVDDEVWVIRGLLKKINWSKSHIEIVGTATDGFEAYNLALALKPDLIITDVRMPEMDGLELIEKLSLVLPACVVIILSGYDDFTYVQKALRLGAFDYILKPIDNTAFEEVLMKVNQRIDASPIYTSTIQEDDKLPEKNKINSRIKNVIEFVENNFSDDINLTSIASEFKLNLSYLSSTFKKQTGMNFSDYLSFLRIKKAKQLIIYTDYKINVICDKVGISSYRQFVRLFRKITNMSPSEYRKKTCTKNLND